MAEVSLKIKAELEKAQADFKSMAATVDMTEKQFKKLQEQMSQPAIDKFMQKARIAGVAMTAAKGSTAGLTTEMSKLQNELARLLRSSLDPMSPAILKMKTRIEELQGQLPKASSGFGAMGNAVMALGAGFGAYQIANKIYDIGKASLQAAANMEQQTVAFTTMLGSAAMAENLLKDLQSFAASTPFSFNELTEASRKMIAFGFSAKEIIPNMRMLGDVAAGLSQPVGDIAYLFGQVKTQGKAMTQDLNQFANRGIPIYEELAKVLGISTAQVRDFASQGKIGFKEIEQVFKNMTGEGGKFGGLMEAQAQTLSGKWSNFGDNLDRIAVTIGKKMTPAASGLIDFLNVLTESDTSEFTRNMSGIVKLQEEYIELKKKGFTADYQKGEIIDSERLKGIIVPMNATMEQRLAIYKQISTMSKEEAQNAGLLQRTEMANLLLLDQHKNKVLDIAEAYIKANGGDPNKKKDTGTAGVAKTEAQMMQDNLNAMAMSQEAFEQQRLNTMQSFYDQRVALQATMNEEEMAAFVAQETMKIANSKLTDDQKLAAMVAMNNAVKKNASAQLASQVQWGQQLLGTTGSMISDLQTIMTNAGKKSHELAVAGKAIAMAQAIVNTSLAFTKSLAAFPYPFNLIAAGITAAAGAAQVGAIASTPIPKAETGLTNYTVPDIRANRNDGASVMAQAGEEVTVTPRGESGNGLTNININVSEQTIFSIVAKGIKTGQIDLNSKNVGRGVFAN